MKILIIGNGFDLAHGLPTTYKDFLDFIKLVHFKYSELSRLTSQNKEPDNCSKDMKDFVNNLFKKIENDPSNNRKLNAYAIQKYEKVWDKLSKENKKNLDCIKTIYKFANSVESKNFWIELFINISKKCKKENWSDFETTISLIIQHIDYFRNCKNDDNRKKFLDHNLESLSNTILNSEQGHSQNSYENEIKRIAKNMKEIDKLEEDLKKLTKILELYLEQITSKNSIEGIDFFKDLNANKVISFNYTNTYEILYDTDVTLKADYCFIHGKIQNSEGNNMVLGIDDYLKGEDANLDLNFIRFKKYYQRLYKKTNCDYKDWLKDKEDKEVHIYGHSLDISDKDILKEIIETENTNTIIYYYNEIAYDQQIINLIKILGKDNLLKRVYNKNIKFLSTASIK